MKKIKQFVFLILISCLIFAVNTTCDKDEDFIEEFVKDYDGNIYHTIKIGSQVWTVENLKTTRYNDGTEITNIKDDALWKNTMVGAYCNYNRVESNADTLGRLYNWHAVNTGKLAPIGWHVPTETDWDILVNYLIDNGYNFDGTKNEDKVAKSLASTRGWILSENIGASGAYPEENNSSGFTGIPAGCRLSSGEFFGIGNWGHWWTSTKGHFGPKLKALGSYSNHLFNISVSYDNTYGYSVRLVRDN